MYSNPTNCGATFKPPNCYTRASREVERKDVLVSVHWLETKLCIILEEQTNIILNMMEDCDEIQIIIQLFAIS